MIDSIVSVFSNDTAFEEVFGAASVSVAEKLGVSADSVFGLIAVKVCICRASTSTAALRSLDSPDVHPHISPRFPQLEPGVGVPNAVSVTDTIASA